MAKQVMPRVELEPRPTDVRLTDDEFMKLSLFSQLKRKPTLEKFPGALVLRFFRQGEEVFRQGEAGWTAYYILTSEDVLELRQRQLQATARESEKKALQSEIAVLEQRLARIKASDDDSLRTAATVKLAVARAKRDARTMARLFSTGRAIGTGPVRNREGQSIYIPVDGPRTLSYDSLSAPLQEGELFGEMSCLYRAPRSATVVARRDCYMIEILRNILDQIQKDPAYKAQSDEVYKKRVLDLQIRKLSIFSDISQQEFEEIRDNVELLSVDPGTLICDEHDRSDSLYIVRSGLVKVIKNVSSLLGPDDVKKWKELGAALRQGEAEPATPTGKVWQLLPERSRTILRAAPDAGRLNSLDRTEVLCGLNEVIKKPGLADAPEFKPLLGTSPLREQCKDLLAQRDELKKKKKDLSEQDNRRFNRFLLEAVFGDMVRCLAQHSGPECILSYCSRGDYLGEIGLMLNQPRSATCIAFGHPNDYGQVELVRLPGPVFWKLMKTSATVRDKVKQEIARRRRHTIEQLLKPVWDDSQQVHLSERFESLGLIQGQKLMLIDLDRCTRCDECVKACVATHDDGHSRLFLDGPRFGKYLVPTSCRSCLDPVCMIGCPVGSIHRGDNRQIVIEDWCIGCSLCADNCPYGSIQMHDLGIIPEKARGWRYLPAAAVPGDKWRQPGFHDAAWLTGEGPFYHDRTFQEELAARRPKKPATLPLGLEQAVNFRYKFELPRELFRDNVQLKLEVVSQAATVTVALNGQELTPDDKPKRGRREFSLETKPAANGTPAPSPRAGRNVLAVQVTPPTNSTDVLFQARLDEVRRPKVPEAAGVDENIAEEITEKVVTQRAVVCDLCSSSPGKVPACVHACPHDAALRVNARSEFPTR